MSSVGGEGRPRRGVERVGNEDEAGAGWGEGGRKNFAKFPLPRIIYEGKCEGNC